LLRTEERRSYENSIKILASETFSSVSAPIQFAAIKAFEGNLSEYLLKSRKILNAGGNYVYEILESNNVSMNNPMGGFD
jgi:hypothetical protein